MSVLLWAGLGLTLLSSHQRQSLTVIRAVGGAAALPLMPFDGNKAMT
jgi:hypothetical protein